MFSITYLFKTCQPLYPSIGTSKMKISRDIQKITMHVIKKLDHVLHFSFDFASTEQAGVGCIH
ncbi:hypothetical protein HanPSC8_Chr14g0595391 [Helianthus annuus]|nr:hypothetical protein HanPSC8_Chr14g0595391 [Helianthus annuus]